MKRLGIFLTATLRLAGLAQANFSGSNVAAGWDEPGLTYCLLR